jgi:transposase
MQDRELYRQLMGLHEPWAVTEVKVDFDGRKVDVWVEWPLEQPGPCPECTKPCRIYDHREERQWRHLDTMQFQTIVHWRIARVKCPEHGIKSMEVPWAEKHSRFTALFERLAIDVLLGCQNQSKAKELLKLSWDELHLIQEKAVQRGLGRRVAGELKHLGVDEKSFLKGHQYATVLSDLNQRCVLDVARDRKEESLEELLNKLAEPQRDKVKAVAMDMWEPFIIALEKWLPQADIVHDKFHIAKYLGEAVDKVRRAENRNLVNPGQGHAEGDEIFVADQSSQLDRTTAGVV